MDGSEERTYHRPFTIIVEGIHPVPYVRTLPAQPQYTINHVFSRNKAREMIAYLEKELLQEHLDFITVEITGPNP